MPPQQPELKENKPADVIHLGFGFASIHAGCVTPFIRSSFGVHAFRSYWMSFLLMFFYAGFANCPLLAWYIVPWLVMVVLRRLTADGKQHSMYQGFPWVFGWMTNEYVARIGELFLMFFAGMFASMVSRPLATFVLAEIVSLLIVLAIETATLQARKRALIDARLQARRMSDLMRGGNGW